MRFELGEREGEDWEHMHFILFFNFFFNLF